MPAVWIPSLLRSCSTLAVSLLLLAGSSTLSSCSGLPPPDDGEGREGEGEGEGDGDNLFVDHTLDRLSSVADYETHARTGPSSQALKMVLTRFGTGLERVSFLDSRFYALHDEYYWFRLLNGVRIDGLADPPVTTTHGPFAAVQDIVLWAKAEQAAGRRLPLDLTFVDGGLRLYSPRFYDLALFRRPRELGVATLLRFPARDASGDVDATPERWALELEFQDTPTVAELRTFLTTVEAALPDEIARGLVWITRSLAQEQLAAALPADLRERTISFRDVVVPGATEVYAEGTTAGRVLVVPRGEEALLQTTRSSDVVVVDDVPGFLPTCAALITSQPQTALAHVNLLARNRGTPNAYRAGAVVDANLDQLGRVRAPVVVRARAPGELVIQPISEGDFATWLRLTAPPPTAVPPIDLTSVEPTYDLAAFSFADEETLRPIVGGKAAGFLALLDARVATVDRPLAVSIAPYVEHIATTTDLLPRLRAMLVHSAFVADVNVRRLVLEGEGAVDPAIAAAFRAGHQPGTTLRDLVDDGGVQALIEHTPVAAGTLAAIDDAAVVHFGRYDDRQALRFRSSSNVEDAEGFNGAGLYTSNSGFLRPGAGEPSLEDALRATWASYWGSEAFEERRLANVDHLSGAMGAVVHANFPDDVERSNGVATFTVLPRHDQADTPGGYVLEVNQQPGASSVTNPPPGTVHLPEIDRVVLASDDDTPRIERVRPSTLSPEGSVVLDDATLLQMFHDARRVTERWLSTENEALFAAQQRSTLTLDLETRVVEAGWPALRSGLELPSRLVWKQARTLEPGIRAPADVVAQPIPRDVLSRARRVERRSCTSDALTLVVVEAITDPALAPDMGFSALPFTSFAIVDFDADVPALGVAAGDRRSAVHTVFADVSHPVFDATRWSLDVVIEPERRAVLGLDRLTVSDDGTVTLEAGGTFTTPATCSRELLFAAPADFLASLLPSGPSNGLLD